MADVKPSEQQQQQLKTSASESKASASESKAGSQPVEKAQPEVEVEFTRPTSQLDLEARQKEAARVAEEGADPVYVDVNPVAVDNDEGFIGTDPIYYGRANETDLPLESEEGPDAQAEADYAKAFEKPDHEKAAKEREEAEKKTSQ